MQYSKYQIPISNYATVLTNSNNLPMAAEKKMTTNVDKDSGKWNHYISLVGI